MPETDVEQIRPETAEQTPAAVTEAETEAETEKARKQAEAEARRAKQRRRRRRAVRDLIIRTLSLLLVVYILFFHLVGVTLMPNADMYPRIDAGDLVLYYRLEKQIHAQDIVVFEKPSAALELMYQEGMEITEVRGRTPASEKTTIRRALDWLGFRDPTDPPMTQLVCRVIAGPGDTVEINESERPVINGNTVIETNIFYNTPEYAGFVSYPLTLGENEYFVLADYRNGGADSRFFGPVRKDEIDGTVITILRRNNL